MLEPWIIEQIRRREEEERRKQERPQLEIPMSGLVTTFHGTGRTLDVPAPGPLC